MWNDHSAQRNTRPLKVVSLERGLEGNRRLGLPKAERSTRKVQHERLRNTGSSGAQINSKRSVGKNCREAQIRRVYPVEMTSRDREPR